MTQVELTSELKVELVDYMGTDLTVVNAARVSLNKHSDVFEEKDSGLVRYLMTNRHASPFEHCVASIRVTAPIFVVREWHRHRTQSFNEISGRYSELEPKFYAPDLDRPLIQVGKPGAYRFELPEDDAVYYKLWSSRRWLYQQTWDIYQQELESGIAKEVARQVLPVSVYTGWYATANLRNWLNFLFLRTEGQAMHEIRVLANQTEELLEPLFPATMAAWQKNGRQAL